MKIIFFLRSLLIPVACIFFIASCNNENHSADKDAAANTNSKDSAEKHNDAKFDKAGEKDAQAVVDAYSASMFEMNVSDSVKMYTKNEAVRSLASEMSNAHAEMDNDIRQLASKKTISLPSALTGDQVDKINSLKAKKDMDKQYVKDLVSAHKDAIDLFQKSADNASDADIKAWFTHALPELRKHLDMAMSLEDRMNKD